jgi:hypothetical protein
MVERGCPSPSFSPWSGTCRETRFEVQRQRSADGGPSALIDEANSLRATAVRKRDARTALNGIDTALKALEMFAKLSGQLRDPQHNHLHLHGEVPSRGEAIETARELLGGIRAKPVLTTATQLAFCLRRSHLIVTPITANCVG